MMKKLALAAAVAAVFSGSALAATPVSSAGGTLKAVIGNNGTFDGSGPGLSWSGTEFVALGTYASWFVFNDGVDHASTYGDSSFAFAGSSTTPAGTAAATTLASGGWAFSQVTSAPNENKLAVTLNITNNTGSAAAAMFSVGFDPDQGIPQGLGFGTTNKILATGGDSDVSATAGLYTVSLHNDTSAAAFKIFPYINVGNCCGTVGPVGPAFQGVGFTTFGDDSINLIYDLGTIAAGHTVSIGYSYNFAAIPEPETYALMLAGLAAVGFMARRRKA